MPAAATSKVTTLAAGECSQAPREGERQGERERKECAVHSFTASWKRTVRGAPAVKWRAMVSVGWPWLWKSEA